MTDQDLRIIGVITAPHGLQGAVKINPLSDFPERFAHLKSCYLRRRDGSVSEAKVIDVRQGNRCIYLTFDMFRTRNEAELLRGCEVCVAEKDSWPLPENTYYVSDLIGFRVVSDKGEDIGRLTDVIRGAQDILQIEGRFGELLVPFVNEWVGEVNLVEKSIQIHNWRLLAAPMSYKLPPDSGEL
jgi:16S rRNA processing protein RimM